MADLDAVLRRHGFHALAVKAVVDETADTRSFVLDVPDELADTFRYQPGQFCTFRLPEGEGGHARCYSMSSDPGSGDDLTVTVKRVPDGRVSNWLNDHVSVGDLIEVSPPAGTFCLRPGQRRIIGFCGGSGVTPLMSLARHALAGTDRPVHLLYANRDADSVIFDAALAELARTHPDQLELRRHLDDDHGYLDGPAVVEFVSHRLDADFYICGPAPFMDLVEGTLLDLGVDPDRIAIERFVTPDQATSSGLDDPLAGESAASPGAAAVPGAEPQPEPAADIPAAITLILRGKTNEVPYHVGDTVLETARRANLSAPSSCEAGNCATCMALVRDGSASMRANTALTADEVEEGWVLTCQALPTSPSFTVEYEPM
jgi:3-ketosteroid 9alpha-monooxygenase subunit B